MIKLEKIKFDVIDSEEFLKKANSLETIGSMPGEDRKTILTVKIQKFTPREVYGEAGYHHKVTIKRKVRDKDGNWIEIQEEEDRYVLSPADKEFIYRAYVFDHLDQRQISKVSGIPQPYVYRYIKHLKLKPKYSQDNTIPEDFNFNFNTPFDVDPYPKRSEWKCRREALGLKNGEDWRNHNASTGNVTARQYGDGSTNSRKKKRKKERKEIRHQNNVKKFNSGGNYEQKTEKEI